MKKLRVEGPESPEAVEAAYQASTDKYERERLLAIRLGQQGCYTLEEIGQIVGRGRATVGRWVKAYRTEGLPDLLRREYPGRKGRVSESVLEEVREGLRQGHWKSAGELHRWLEKHGVALKRSGVYYWLSKIRASWKVPRKSHVKKAPGAEETFQAAFVSKLEGLSLPAEGRVRIWVLDEHRYGLISFIRRCWTLRGHRPKAPYHTKYQWGYIYAAADVVTGDLQVLYTPTVSREWTQIFFQQILATDPEAFHIVLLDQAGYHPQEGEAWVPEGIYRVSFPPYCPELNPIEGLWDRVKRRLGNVAWDLLETMQVAITEVLAPFWEHVDRVRTLLGAPWLTQGVTTFLNSRNRLILN
jgi:transposase